MKEESLFEDEVEVSNGAAESPFEDEVGQESLFEDEVGQASSNGAAEVPQVDLPPDIRAKAEAEYERQNRVADDFDSAHEQSNFVEVGGTGVKVRSERFDTPLTKDEEAQFQEWKKKVAPNDSGMDYDWRGAFKDGDQADANGHWPDKHKKPNHPTFSTESRYAQGDWANEFGKYAGTWNGDQYEPSAWVREHQLTYEERPKQDAESEADALVERVKARNRDWERRKFERERAQERANVTPEEREAAIRDIARDVYGFGRKRVVESDEEPQDQKYTLTKEGLSDASGRTTKPGGFLTIEREDGSTDLVRMVGVAKDGALIFAPGESASRAFPKKEFSSVGTGAAMSEREFNYLLENKRAAFDRTAGDIMRLNLMAETGWDLKPDEQGLAVTMAVRAIPFLGRYVENAAGFDTFKALDKLHSGDFGGTYDADKIYAMTEDAGIPMRKESGETVRDYKRRIERRADEELFARVKSMDWAKAQLEYTKKTGWDKFFVGAAESSGYMFEYMIPGTALAKLPKAASTGAKIARGAMQLAAPAAASAVSRYKQLTQNEWRATDDGRLVMVHKADEPGVAAAKAVAGGVAEAAIEEFAVPALWGGAKWLTKGAAHQLGRIGVFGAIGDAAGGLAGKATDAFLRSKAGHAVGVLANKVHELKQSTGIDLLPLGEQTEETLQALMDNPLGLDKKSSEYKGLSAEWDDFRRDTLSWDGQLDIFIGLAGQLLAGGSASLAAGAHAHYSKDAKAFRQELRGRLERANIPNEVIDSLSPRQWKYLDHVYRAWSDNPEKLQEWCNRAGIIMGDAGRRIVQQQGLDFARTLEQRGVQPERFEFPLKNGPDGKPVPDFTRQVRVDTAGQVEAPMVVDQKHGVSVVDNEDGTYTVVNGLRGDTHSGLSEGDALKAAQVEVLRNQSMDLDNRSKTAYLLKLHADQFHGRQIGTVPSEYALRQVLEAGFKEGKTPYGLRSIDDVFDGFGNLKVNGAGGFHTPDGTIVLILDNIKSPSQMSRVLGHESGHGMEAEGRNALDVEFLKGTDPNSQYSRFREATFGNVRKRFIDQGMDEADADREAREVLDSDRGWKETFANWVQRRTHNPTRAQVKEHEAREARRANGENLPFNDADWEVWLSKAESSANAGTGNVVTSGHAGVEFIPVEEAKRTEATDETGRRPDEAQPQPEQVVGKRPGGAEAPRPAEVGEAGAETPREGVVEPSESDQRGQNLTVDEQKKPVEERSVIEKMTEQAPVQELPVSEVFNDDTRIPNFKEGANPETGEVEPLQGEPYDLVSNPIVVMEFKDGKKVVVTGRHRLALYKRAGREKIAARVIREADGWTVQDAKMIDSIGNIIDEKGSVKDYVKYFEDAKPSREAADAGGFLARPKGKLAFSIYEGATEDTRSAIDWEGGGSDGMISVEQAGIIAEAAPRNGNPRNKALQRILVRKALDGLRGKKLGILARSLAEEVRTQKAAPSMGGEMQLDLFSSAEDQELLAMEEKRADYRTKKAQEYNRIAEVLRTAMSKGGKLDLNEGYARELGITDPKDKKQLAAARDKAVERANYWENALRLDEADKAAMDAEINATADAKAKRVAELKAKREAANSGKPAPKPAPKPKAEKPVAEPPKNTPTSAPKKTEATTPPKSAEAPQGAESPKVGARYTKETQRGVDFPVGTVVKRADGRSYQRAEGVIEELGRKEPKWIDLEGNGRPAYQSHVFSMGGGTVTVIPEAKSAEGPQERKVAAASMGESAPSAPAATPRTPSIKMKNEAAEKIAQKQEDDLAALFDTPELSAEKENPAVNGALDHHNENAPRAGSASPQPKVALNRKAKVSQGTAEIVPQPASEVKRRIQTYRNGDITVRVNDIPTLLRDIGALFKMRYMGRSRYATYEAKIGNILFRLSDHNASGANFSRDKADKYVSVYVEGVTYQHQGTPIAYTEIRFPNESYMRNARGVANAIIDGVESLLDTGDFKVDPNIAQKVEYPVEIDLPVTSPAFLDETKNALAEPSSEANPAERAKSPRKTKRTFKLFRKYPDGTYGALFIDSAKRLSIGEWYQAQSPTIESLRSLDGRERDNKFKWGQVYLFDASGKAVAVDKMPTVREVNAVAQSGGRYMTVAFGADGKKLFYNLGINGSGSVAGYAFRPGWHSTNAPSAGHIGKSHGMDGVVAATGQNHYRLSNEVWVEIAVPDDVDYNGEALSRAPFLKEKGREHEKNRKEAQLDHIPENGSYFYRTNSNADEKQDWIISGAIKLVREVPRQEVNKFNRENGFLPDAPIADSREEAALKQNATPSDISWYTSDFDTDLFQKRVGAVAKLVKTYQDSGVADFKTLATRMAERFPDKFGAMKPYLRGVWNAVAEQMDLDEISKKDAEATFAAIEKPQEAAPAPEAPKAPPANKLKETRISDAADEIVELIESGEKFTRKEVTDIVERQLGGKVSNGDFDAKQVTDILELAVNRWIRTAQFTDEEGLRFVPDGDSGAAVDKIRALRDMLANIPTQTTRSIEQDKMQQFSTPPQEAFAAAWVANMNDGDVMLEPSAGIGGLAVFGANAGAKVVTNELSPRRAEILEQLGLGKPFEHNAENLYAFLEPDIKAGKVKRPTVVVMNPPFSNSQRTDKKNTHIGADHVEQALKLLAPGGRLVAIVGNGMAHDRPAFKAWWDRIGREYTVRANVGINGQEYAKYGTTFDNNLIVIDKVVPNGSIAPIYGKIESLDQLPAMLEGVRNDRPTAKVDQRAQPAPREQGGGGGVAPNGRISGQYGTVRSATGASQVGVGGQDASGQRDGRPVRPQAGAVTGVGQKDNGSNGGRGVGRGRSGEDGRVNSAGLDNGRDSAGPVLPAGPAGSAEGLAVHSVEQAREVGDGTFSEYKPSKISIPGMKPHPTALVESSAMASVQPPNPTYSPKIPKKIIEDGVLSEAQIEQVVYAGQAHEQMLGNGERKGYFIGDGTGVGKGREISGVILDNYNNGRRKAVWVSKTSGLSNDAKRDLTPFGLAEELFTLETKNLKGLAARGHGVAFTTYSSLAKDHERIDERGNVIASKQGKESRMQALVNWLGRDFDGVIVFDESHLAGNAVPMKGKRGMTKPSAQALAVVDLQKALPKARILYVSATGATEVNNLAYATRLGLWGRGTAFKDRDAFITQVSNGGISVMEIVARDMKAMGVYMARTLSYEGIENERVTHELSPDQVKQYNLLAETWQMVMGEVESALISSGGIHGKANGNVKSAFWGAHQRFFNQTLTAMQMPTVLARARELWNNGYSPVFQIVTTNEAAQNRAIQNSKDAGGEVDVENLDLSPRDILIGFVDQSFPTVQYVEESTDGGKAVWVPLTDAKGNYVHDPAAVERKERLLGRLQRLKMGEAPLDMILNEFGHENVAEVTGRSARREMVRNSDGEMEIKIVRRTKNNAKQEADEFNDGKRTVLVFSGAGNTGFSFHADRKFGNQRRRVQFMIEAGYNAAAAIQGLGRTHRANESSHPLYMLCSTNLPGHKRFMSTIARRLAQLGSLTSGDRSSSGSGVFSEADNLENQYAKNAVMSIFEEMFEFDQEEFNRVCTEMGFMKAHINNRTGEREYVNMLINDEGEFDPGEKLDVPHFLNRILAMKIDAQNELFDKFSNRMAEDIERAKENGTFDPGMEKLKGITVEVKNRTRLWEDAQKIGTTDIVEVGVTKKSRKTDYATAKERLGYSAADGAVSRVYTHNGSGEILMMVEMNKTQTMKDGSIVSIFKQLRPNGETGYTTETAVEKNYTQMTRGEEDAWAAAYDATPDLIEQSRFFANGTLLPIWDRLGSSNPRFFKVAPTGGAETQTFLGMEIAPENVENVLARFGKSVGSVVVTPDVQLRRVMKDGKRVELQNGWTLKRVKVLGDNRIEIDGVDEDADVIRLAQSPFAYSEKIGYLRVFLKPNAESMAQFLEEYPAVPDKGSLATASGTAQDLSGDKYIEPLNSFWSRLENATPAEARQIRDEAHNLIVRLSNEQLGDVFDQFALTDNGRTSASHVLRKMALDELVARSALDWKRRQQAERESTSGEVVDFDTADLDGNRRRTYGVPYQGSKSRIAKGIVDALPRGRRFVDLFSGGGAVTHAAMESGKYGEYRMNDLDGTGQDLFLEGVRGKWDGYSRKSMTHEEFAEIKGTPEALAWSFNGLGRNIAMAEEGGRDRAAEQIRRVQSLSSLKDKAGKVVASKTDYRKVKLHKGDVVYADIPYEGTDTRGYGKGESFDKVEFIDWAQRQGVPVFVSEYAMPNGWTEVAAFGVRGMRGGNRAEKLFVQSKFAGQVDFDTPELSTDSDEARYRAEYARRKGIAERMGELAEEWGSRTGNPPLSANFGDPNRVGEEYASLRRALNGVRANLLDELTAKHGAEWARAQEIAVDAQDSGVDFDTPSIFTGTTADYEKPSMHFVGTGEGAQVYGWGLYGSTVRSVAESYVPSKNEGVGATHYEGVLKSIEGRGYDAARKRGINMELIAEELEAVNGSVEALIESLSRYGKKYDADVSLDWVKSHQSELEKKVSSLGDYLYEQSFFTDRVLGDESHLLSWYEPVSEENAARIANRLTELKLGAEAALEDVAPPENGLSSFLDATENDSVVYRKGRGNMRFDADDFKGKTGQEVYHELERMLGSAKAASDFLASADIDGIKYPVDSYGGKTLKDGNVFGWNYVSFRDDNIRVDHKWRNGELLFDTQNLSPAEAEYADRADKTPTEKDMREVFGMTNDEIAAALKAQKMEPMKGVRKSDERLWEQAETLLSNPTYMAKLSRAAFKFARPLRDYENVALSVLMREREAKVNKLQELHDELAAIPKEDLKETPELADELKATAADLSRARQELYETATAMMQGASEQGRALRSNRVLLNKFDLSFAGISQSVAEAVGGADKIPPQILKEIKELADKFAELDEKGRELYASRLKAFSEKAVNDIKNGAKVRRATERKVGDEAKRVTKNYMDALAQIEVAANENGGTLVGMSDQQYPGWGKWLKALGEFHCYENPNITEEEVIKAILDDISPFVDADENAVRDALTGFGHNYKQSRYDSQRLMNDLKSQARMKRQLDWMNEKGELPPATGMVRDAPSDTARNLAKQVQEKKKEIPDAERDARHLKGVLDSAKTRVRNRIADMERAIETGERIPASQRKVVEDIELRELKKRKAELQEVYDEMFRTDRTMTEAQRIAATEKALQKSLEHAMEDYARAMTGDFSKRPTRPGVTSDTIEATRKRIAEVRDSIRELKKAKYEYGLTPEEIATRNARKVTARERALMRLAEKVARGDTSTQKKPQPPMPPDMQKQYDELGRQMKNAHRRLNQMRDEARRQALPAYQRGVLEYLKYFSGLFTAHMASFDRSATMRQALKLTVAHPMWAAKAMGVAERAAWNEKHFQKVNEELLEDPVIREAVEKYGLKLRSSDLANIHDVEMFSLVDRPPPKMIKRLNEALDKIPGLGWIYGGIRKFDRFMLENSERHYVTYLNLMAVQTYKAVIDAIPGATDWQKRKVAGLVNMLAGAGAMSDKTRNSINSVNDLAGHLVWSPNLWMSQIQQKIGADVWGAFIGSREGGKDGKYSTAGESFNVAKEALKLRLRAEIAILALGAMLAYLWSDDDWFAEYKKMWKDGRISKAIEMTKHPVLGNTHIDLEMGQRTFARFASHAFTGEYETSTGRIVKATDYGATGTEGAFGRYFFGKLSPVFSTAYQAFQGKSYSGQPFGWGDLLTNMLPLTPSDIAQSAVADEWGSGQAPVAIALTILGAGGNVYEERYYKRAVNWFNNEKDKYDEKTRKEIEGEIKSINSDERKAKKSEKEGKPWPSDELQKIEEKKNALLKRIQQTWK